VPPPSDEAPLLEWALWYASQGWAVFPCYGKVPITRRGFLDATRDAAQVRSWWSQWPEANIGLPIPAGQAVLDVDPRNGGSDTMHTLQQLHGTLPDTLTSLTGGGGQHLFFTTSLQVKNKTQLGDGIDVQAQGSYVIAPPSVHPVTGKRYLWDAAYGPDTLGPEPLPAWLEDLIAREDDTPAARSDQQAPIREGTRETTLMALAGAMQRQGASADAIRSALEAENQRCVPPLDGADLDRMTRSVGRYTPAPRLEVGPARAGTTRALDPLQILWALDGKPADLHILQAYWAPGITGAWSSGKEPVTWWLCFGDQEISLGTTHKLQDQKHVRGCIFEVTRVMPPHIGRIRTTEWDACLNALAAIAAQRHEPEVLPINQARSLILSYLDKQTYTFQMDMDDDEWKTCSQHNQPFRRDGKIYIHCRQWHIDHLRHLTDVTYGQALGLLRHIGHNETISLQKPKTSRYYWRIDVQTLFDSS
jgi:hypothetical protein